MDGTIVGTMEVCVGLCNHSYYRKKGKGKMLWKTRNNGWIRRVMTQVG